MSKPKQSLCIGVTLIAATILAFFSACLLFTGCGTVGSGFAERNLYALTTNWYPHVVLTTNTVTVTNTIREVVEKPIIQVITNTVAGVETISTKTNFVTVTNVIDKVIERAEVTQTTNQIAKVELVDKPGVENALKMVGGIPVPWAGVLSTGLLAVYHLYSRSRNKKVNQALVQGGEDLLALLHTKEGSQLRDQGIELLQKAQARYGVLPDVASMVEKWTGDAPKDPAPTPNAVS